MMYEGAIHKLKHAIHKVIHCQAQLVLYFRKMEGNQSPWNPERVESRLIDFASDVINFGKVKSTSYSFLHLSQQLIRSSTSAALNYGESRAAESYKDLIHKQRLVLKELRECHVNLRITDQSGVSSNVSVLEKLLDECNQLVAMFVATIRSNEQRMKGPDDPSGRS